MKQFLPQPEAHSEFRPSKFAWANPEGNKSLNISGIAEV